MLLIACAGADTVPTGSQGGTGPATAAIHVTSNGWHSGIVVGKADLTEAAVPETVDFPAARFFEFGWGDAVYYPARETTIGMTLSAALLPTPAVVHVVGLDRHPAEVFPGAEVVSLAIGTDGLSRLVDYIGSSFERSGQVRATTHGPGLYANSRFYPATGRFHLFNTCNTWTAKGLAAAGFAVDPSAASRAGSLMEQVRRLAANH